MDKVELKFVMDIVGHDEETIRQMYNDWISSPKYRGHNLHLEVKENPDAIEYLGLISCIELLEKVKAHLIEILETTESLNKEDIEICINGCFIEKLKGQNEQFVASLDCGNRKDL